MKCAVLLVCLTLALISSACRKKHEPAPSVAIPGVATGNEAQMAASNAAVMTMMLQEFVNANGRVPNDLNELATIKTFGPVPKAPVGYKFVIDGKQKQILAVKE